MLHTKFHENWQVGSYEEDFMGFRHIWSTAILGHVTSIISTNFHFLVPKNLVTNGPVVSEKSMF